MTAYDYIPATDEGFKTWANTFASKLVSDNSAYMMSPAEAAGVQAAVDNFNVAFDIAAAPETRTKATIIDRNNARSIAENLCRDYAMLIKENKGISDADKVNAGVRPINPDREPIEVPTTQPLLNILGNTPGTQTVVFADSSTPDKRAKPFGAASMQLFMAKATEADAPFSEAKFVGNFSRNPIDISFDEADDGKVATYYGRWVSTRGDVSPMSLAVSMRIAA